MHLTKFAKDHICDWCHQVNVEWDTEQDGWPRCWCCGGC